MMPDALKSSICAALVAALVAVAGFIFREAIVRTFVVPTVLEELRDEGILRDKIVRGRFVVTELDEFGENYEIDSRVLLDLNERHFETLSTLRQLGARAAEHQEALNAVTAQIDGLRRISNELSLLAEAQARGCFEVKLYVSDQTADKGRAVLNSDNLLIGSLLRNGQPYTLSAGPQQRLWLPVRLEPTSEGGEPSTFAIGRLHRDDYHTLFEGARRVGIANVYLK